MPDRVPPLPAPTMTPPLSRLAKRLPLYISLAVLAALVGAAVFAPYIAPHAPDAVDVARRLAPPGGDNILGTDHLGRDILSRLIWGARVSLGAVLVIAVFILAAGFTVGALSGWFGGWFDTVVMRVCEIFMTFPTFILAMFMVGVLGRGITNVILAIVLTHWAWYARITRSIVLGLKNRDYILAARAAGGTGLGIFRRHVAPATLSQLLILATLDLGHMMLHVSGLSFLGLGIQPPTPEWGVMINDARALVWTHPGLVVLPGLMILLTVLACNIPGDYLRDRLDPALADEGH